MTEEDRSWLTVGAAVVIFRAVDQWKAAVQ
jgi:hypothetical protein